MAVNQLIGRLFPGVKLALVKQRLKHRQANPDYSTFVSREFRAIHGRHKHNTMVNWHGCFVTHQGALHVARHGVPGAIVECGVWRGGQTAIMADTLAEAGVTDRDIYLYDTFEGMTAPGEMDGSRAFTRFEQHQKAGELWAAAGEDVVRATLANTAYPQDRFTLVKGDVLQTIPGTLPDKIALLRLDTDFYDSTKHELEHLFPLLVSGGVFICDDYKHWQGSESAVNEYFSAHGLHMLLQQDSGHASVMAIKP